MFRSSNKLLSTVPCPKFRAKRSCSIPYCLFSHNMTSNRSATRINSLKRPLSTSSMAPNCSSVIPQGAKIRKVVLDKEPNATEVGQSSEQIVKVQVGSMPPVATSGTSSSNSVLSGSTVGNLVIKSLQSQSAENIANRALFPSSRTSSIPGSLDKSASSESHIALGLTKDCILSPKPVIPFAPATNQQRLIYLKAISKVFKDMNHKFPNYMAVVEEHKIAQRTSKVTYANEIRHLVARIKRSDDLNVQVKIKPSEKPKLSADEINRRVATLIINPEVLAKHGYAVTTTIASVDPSSNSEDLKNSSSLNPDSLVNCDRCDTLFNVLSEDSRVGKCVYHPGKKRRANAGSTTSVDRDLFYTCCSEPVGDSAGCETNRFHVFKHKTLAGLSDAIPYHETTSKVTANTRYAVGIDCEMAYTTLGMELIRVTVVDWDSSKAILDRLVMPKGEVLDLNSAWSGVHTLDEGLIDNDGRTHPTLTFEETRDLLFDFVNKDTIIVGHGLENDLNALRLIHKRVVDTAIHYPRFNSHRKRSLKDLAAMYLKREIQNGEHDSSEDAIAAIDIVKFNIGCEI